jgi:hypothetical protein
LLRRRSRRRCLLLRGRKLRQNHSRRSQCQYRHPEDEQNPVVCPCLHVFDAFHQLANQSASRMPRSLFGFFRDTNSLSVTRTLPLSLSIAPQRARGQPLRWPRPATVVNFARDFNWNGSCGARFQPVVLIHRATWEIHRLKACATTPESGCKLSRTIDFYISRGRRHE